MLPVPATIRISTRSTAPRIVVCGVVQSLDDARSRDRAISVRGPSGGVDLTKATPHRRERKQFAGVADDHRRIRRHAANGPG